jgi:hypothetical protein
MPMTENISVTMSLEEWFAITKAIRLSTVIMRALSEGPKDVNLIDLDSGCSKIMDECLKYD